MGQAATTRLLDFIYRDPTRLASLYAQVFGGHLVGAEIAESSREAREKSGGFVAGITGSYKTGGEENQSRKENLQPHDTIATGLIRRLSELNFIRDDISTAPNGTLVRFHGSLSFGDGTVFAQLAETMQDHLMTGLMSGMKGTVHENKKTAKSMATMIAKTRIPSVFQLATDTGKLVVGHVKEQGLDEPISSFYFKHGDHSLPDITVIGVKEVTATKIEGVPHQLIGMTHLMANAFAPLLFPADAIRATPIVMFRTISPE